MAQIWHSFIPYHVAQQLLTDAPVGSEQRFMAVALFADVSGFTAMSEALGSVGISGTEELTGILNSYFGPMIDLIHAYGGIVAKFGGDAMTVFFPCQPETLPEVSCQAVTCALEMQAKMANYQSISTQAGVFGLAMKAGLAAGPLFCTIVGHVALRLESIVAGSVLDLCAEAEHHAQKGEVVIHEGMFAPCFEISEKREVFGLVNGMMGVRGKLAPLPPLPTLSPEATETIAAFMHPSIAQRIRTGQTSFINEHRKATILFVSFGGFDYDGDTAVDRKLQEYLYRVIQIVQRYNGYLNKVDMGDKGSKYIILFGVPLANEDDESRALRCSLEIQAIPDMPVSIGINTGFVFSGQVGSSVRQEYTVMGDAVNLAARLMQAAQPGDILVNGTTQKASGGDFRWEAGQSLHVKGKEQPVQVSRLMGLARPTVLQLQEPAYALPMVGRAAELAVIQQKLHLVRQGQGQIVGITAEAGMGKTRLTAEIIKLALNQGFVGYGGECLSHGVNSSYLVWQNLLRGLFGLDPGWETDVQIAHLENVLAILDPSSLPRLPLLGRVLNLTIPDNELTRTMDAKLRKESMESLVVEFVNRMGAVRPLLLVLEDCHWIDALSRDLLAAVGRNIANVPVLLVAVYRPPGAAHEQLPITRLGHFHKIHLAEFTPLEAKTLIDMKLSQFLGSRGSMPAGFVARVLERAQGNPFYIDEMINLVRDQGIDPADTHALTKLHLPDSLHSVIISRLDRLAENTKSTLKVASVIGRLFRADWLWEVYPQLGTPERIKDQLMLLTKMDITPVEKPDSEELAYLFKHILTREVAYESLALATRQMLHEQIGLYIEELFADSLAQYTDLLAHHFALSRNQAKKKVYLALAGQAAQAAYANEAAVTYYQNLLPLLEGAERGAVLLELGTVLQLIGRWDEAQSRYGEALALAVDSDDGHAQGHGEYRLGSLARARGVFAEALQRLTAASEHFTAVNDLLHAANAEMEIGIIDWSQGNYTAALARYESCLQTYRQLADQSGVCRAIGNMGIVYWTLGDHARALDLYGQYQAIATEIGDKLGLSRAMGNMGNVYLDLGNYRQALKYFIDNLHVALELGYRQGTSISVANMGEVYEKQGDYERALPCYRFSLETDLELGDRYGVAFALWNLAKVYLGLREFGTAVSLLELAIHIGRIIDIPYELSDFLFTQAEIFYRLNQPAAALAALEETLRLARSVKHPQVQLTARLLQLRLQAETQEWPFIIDSLSALLTPDLDEIQRAAVQYEVCLLDGERRLGGETAVLYKKLYNQTPNVQYKRRYEQLSGQILPAPPELPLLPQGIIAFATTTESLLQKVESFIQEFAN